MRRSPSCARSPRPQRPRPHRRRAEERATIPPLQISHAKVQRLRRLIGRRSSRREERAFVAEGVKVLGEALASGAHIEAVYIDAAAAGPAEEALAADILAAGGRVFDLAPGVLGRVADTATPQPILGIVGAVDVPLASLVFDRLVLVCADIRDPGNLGTVLRSAEASGAAGVIVCEGSVDPSNAKAVRASAGAVFHVPLVLGAAPAEVLTTLGARGVRRLGTSSHRGAAHTESHLVGPVAVVLGNEASGLPADLDDLLDGFVTIPHEGRSESLNVGMAAAVIAFEAHRQRAVCEAVAQ